MSTVFGIECSPLPVSVWQIAYMLARGGQMLDDKQTVLFMGRTYRPVERVKLDRIRDRRPA